MIRTVLLLSVLVSVLSLGLTSCLDLFLPPLDPEPSADVYGELSHTAKNISGEDAVDICAGESFKLSWTLSGVEDALLEAEPSRNVIPRLDGRQVEDGGSLEVQVLGPADIRLMASRWSLDELSVSLIPEGVCEGFPIPILQNFSGVLGQTTPSPQRLERRLEFFWSNGALFADLTDAAASTTLNVLLCSYNAERDSVSCAGEADKPSLELELQVSAAGLSGMYKGVAETNEASFPYAGTLSFSPEAGE